MTSKSVEERFRQHICDARRGTNCYLHRAINKYGPECFEIFPLEGASTQQRAHKLEVEWIQRLGTYDDQNGYNMTPGGEGQPPGKDHPLHGTTFKFTDEQRKTLSEAQKGSEHTTETKIKLAETHSELDRNEASEVKYIIRETDLTSRRIAKIYGASINSINCISQGRTWTHVEAQKPDELPEIIEKHGNAPHGNSTLTNREAAEIKYLAQNAEMTQPEIGALYGVTRENVSAIKCGRTWKKIDPRCPNKSRQLELF